MNGSRILMPLVGALAGAGLAACGSAPPTTPVSPTTTATVTVSPSPVSPGVPQPTAPEPVRPTEPTTTAATPSIPAETPTDSAATSPPGGQDTCSIRSNSGNCYTAGEICRRRDLGKTTTDAAGRSITCALESGQPHWHYSAG